MPNLADGNSELSSVSTRARMSLAQLLKRVFAIDMAACPQCAGPLTLIGAIEDPTVIAKILAHPRPTPYTAPDLRVL